MNDRKDDSRQATPSRLTRGAVWVISIVMSALVTLYIRDRWEAPRPVVELTSLTFLDPRLGDASIPIPPELVQKVSNHVYLSDLNRKETTESLKSKLEDHVEALLIRQKVEKYVSSLIDLLLQQSPAILLDTRRREFLQLLVDDPSGQQVVDSYAKVTIFDFEESLDARYMTHTPGTESLMVNLKDGVYNLSEIDEAKAEPGADLLAARQSNLYRRLFVYYDQNLLAEFFRGVQKYIKEQNTLADEIIVATRELLDGAKQPRIAVALLVANRGRRPVALQTIGVLRLSVPKPTASGVVPVLLDLTASSDQQELVIVEADEAETVRLMSVETLREIVDRNAAVLGGESWDESRALAESRLMKLYDAKTGELVAAAAIARAGVKPGMVQIGPSAPVPVSAAAAEQARAVLQKAWG